MRKQRKIIPLLLITLASAAALAPGALASIPRHRAHSTPASRQIDLQLARATEHGDVGEMRALLSAGANPDFNRTNTFHYPLLLVAAINGHPAAVSLLLDYGANPEARDLRGTPVLVSAASLITASSAPEKLECVGILLGKGHANPNAKDTARIGDDRSALHLAAANGLSELAEILLKHGANPNQVNRFRETPLYFAAERGNTDIARILLSHGADPNARTRFTRMTPLLAAAQTGQLHVVRLLIEMRADLTARDAFGESPTILAATAAHRASTEAERERCRETLAVLRQASSLRAGGLVSYSMDTTR